VRLGPYRVWPHGLLQPIADTIKLLTKEDLLPPGVNRFYYLLAPFLAISLSLISISVIPFGPAIDVGGVKTWMQLTDLNVGVIFVLAVSSLTVYSVVLAGWSSNSKYPLLGALRSSAQMIGYELPLGMAVASALLMSNSLSLRTIVETQNHYYGGFFPAWNVFRGPFPQMVSFLVFLIAMFAETNRVPFDLPEAESELVAGFHTEYSAMKFAGFFMAEYANMITVACLATLLFLGGWHGPIFGPPILQVLLPVFWFGAKIFAFLFLYIWVRGTLPRFRYDQLMAFGWKFLLPLALANLIVTAIVVVVK
jgi:NADH-quinone oxidoreductase subunit H